MNINCIFLKYMYMKCFKMKFRCITIYQTLTIKWPLYHYCFIVKNNKKQILRLNNNQLAAFTKVQVSSSPPPFIIGL